MPSNGPDYKQRLADLCAEYGSATMAHLIDVLVSERGSLTEEQALLAATQLDWDAAWFEIVGPALDGLDSMLHQALREPTL